MKSHDASEADADARAVVDVIASRNQHDKDIIMIKTFLTRTIASICLASLAIALSACNTMHGAGKDIERGGEKIQQKADEHR